MQKIKSLWGKLPLEFRHVLHTFWQVAGGILLQQLLVAHSSTDVKAAVVAAGASGLAAVKATLVS